MLVSAEQQHESAIIIYLSPPLWASHGPTPGSSQSRRLGSLCNTAESYQLSTLHVTVFTYMSMLLSQCVPKLVLIIFFQWLMRLSTFPFKNKHLDLPFSEVSAQLVSLLYYWNLHLSLTESLILWHKHFVGYFNLHNFPMAFLFKKKTFILNGNIFRKDRYSQRPRSLICAPNTYPDHSFSQRDNS